MLAEIMMMIKVRVMVIKTHLQQLPVTAHQTSPRAAMWPILVRAMAQSVSKDMLTPLR